jgi:DNA end-binding protein Ku
VNLSDEETSAFNIQSTHAIDIFAFVEADEIPVSCFETPYYLTPTPGGEKVYTLLYEVLNRTRKIGIAHVVIQARRRLAALIPCGPVLMLNTLRMADKVSALVDAKLQRKRLNAAKPTEKELATAARVVEGMTQTWDTSQCPDAFDADRTAQASSCNPADILRPRVHPLNEEVMRGDHTIYQSQRESRPRARMRRTYH